jgi:hypothetical protein
MWVVFIIPTVLIALDFEKVSLGHRNYFVVFLWVMGNFAWSYDEIISTVVPGPAGQPRPRRLSYTCHTREGGGYNTRFYFSYRYRSTLLIALGEIIKCVSSHTRNNMSHHVLAVIRMVANNMTEPMSMPRYALKSGRWAAGWMMVGAGHTGRYAHRNIDDDIMEEEEEAKEKGKLEGEGGGGGDAGDGEAAAEDADDDNRAGMEYFHTCIHTVDCLLLLLKSNLYVCVVQPYHRRRRLSVVAYLHIDTHTVCIRMCM